MKSSHVLAIALAVGAAGWVLSGQLAEAPPEAATTTAAEAPPADALPPGAVRVAQSTSRAYTIELEVTGRTEASRWVDLRAQTSGPVAEIAAAEGAVVEEGGLVVQIALDDRDEQLSRAESLVEQREIEAAASAELAESGWRAETSDAGARAGLQAARAELAAIRLDIARTRITAPFQGVLDSLDVELGDVVDDKEEIGTLFDLDPIVVVAAVSEREVTGLAVGAAGSARLITGEEVEGRLRYVGKVAEPQTRTFRIELEVANPDFAIPAGLTADIVLPLATVPAHFVSPSALSLADDGTLGVKIVDEGNVVRFVPVTVVADAADGIWIAGLPDTATLITVGHDYVADGQPVDAVTVEGSAFSTAP